MAAPISTGLIKDNIDDGSKDIVGQVQLKKYGKFLEEYSGQLQDIENALGNSCDNIWDETLNPIGMEWKPIERISILELIQTDNKILNKIVTVFSALCYEIELLITECSDKYYPMLLMYGEYGGAIRDTKNIDAEFQINMGRMIAYLQDLCIFINRCYDIIKYTLQQMAALYNGSQKSPVMDVSNVHFDIVFENLGSLLRCLITLDEIIENHPYLKDHWTLYKRMMKSIRHNPSQFGVEIKVVKLFEIFLTNLESKVFNGLIFSNAVKQIFDSELLNVSKNTLLMDEFANYLRSLSVQTESKIGKNSETNERLKLVELTALYVLYFELYRQQEKKIFKILWESYKQVPSISLFGNVIWFCNEFILIKIPELQKTIDKKSKLAVVTFRQIWLQNKLQTLLKDVQAIHSQVSSWLVKMEKESSNFDKFASKLLNLSFLFSQGLIYIWNLNYLMKDIINLHVNLNKPMTKSCVITVCNMIEMIQAIKAMYHRKTMFIMKNIGNVLQHYQHLALLGLLSAKKKCIADTDKKLTEQRLDVISALTLAQNSLNGPPTKQRYNIIRISLAVACKMKLFKEEFYPAIEDSLYKLNIMIRLSELIHEGSNCCFFYHQTSLLPIYFENLFETANDLHTIHYMFSALSDCVKLLKKVKHVEENDTLLENFDKIITNYLEIHFMKPICSAIETDLRLHTHLHLQLDDMNPFRIGLKNLNNFINLMPIRFMDRLISVKVYVEHYLNTTFYNLTTVALHDWKTYTDMKNLSNQKFNLNLIEAHLPSQTLEQGLDVLEIMRNIHVFVSKYMYNLNNQIFVEKSSNNKHLNTINIRHIANSIRTHGTGIMNTTINFTYQFLRKKFFTFSQFLYDEHIKSRLIKDLRFFKENHLNNDQTYSFDRAEKFNKGIRKLGINKDGLSYLDQFRLLVTQIGNAMGYIRMIRSGGLNYCSNAISFVPDLDDIVNFEEYVKEDNLSEETQKAANSVDNVIENLIRNFAEGTEYFKILVKVFASEFCSTKNKHLSNFFIIVPPLAINYVENSITSKEKLTKKNKDGASFTDDGFAMGVAYILKLLNQYSEFDSLHWFSGVRAKYKAEKKNIQEQLIGGKIEESLKQTYTLTLKRLDIYQQEFDLLYYSLSSARIFFGADLDKDNKNVVEIQNPSANTTSNA